MATPTNTQFAVAVHVLTYLAGTDVPGPVSSDELAASVNASPVYQNTLLLDLNGGPDPARFAAGTNIYVFFGTVKSGWQPSKGGVTGRASGP